MERKTQLTIWYWILAMMALLWAQSIWTEMRGVEAIPYSQFQQLLKDGQVQEITITTNAIRGTLKRPLPDGSTRFVANRVEPELAGQLDQYGVKYEQRIESTFLRDILSWVVPAVVFFALLGGLAAFGPVGLIAGPLVVAFFIAISRTYSGAGPKAA